MERLHPLVNDAPPRLLVARLLGKIDLTTLTT